MSDEVTVTPTSSTSEYVEQSWDESTSGLMNHAKRELKVLGYDLDNMELDITKPAKNEEPNEWIVRDILELIRTFAQQGHSGHSASYCIGMFTKLANWEPLAPLTGDDTEWVDVSDHGDADGGVLYQNNRCSHVFKDNNGAYDIDGKIFVEPDGSAYTSKDSRVPVTFPYTPKTEYVDVPFASEGGIDEKGRD